MIEKQSRVQVVAEIHPKFEAAFLHGMAFGFGVMLFVLLAALLRLVHSRANVGNRHGQDFRQHCQRLAAALPGTLLSDGLWRGIFLYLYVPRSRKATFLRALAI